MDGDYDFSGVNGNKEGSNKVDYSGNSSAMELLNVSSENSVGNVRQLPALEFVAEQFAKFFLEHMEEFVPFRAEVVSSSVSSFRFKKVLDNLQNYGVNCTFTGVGVDCSGLIMIEPKLVDIILSAFLGGGYIAQRRDDAFTSLDKKVIGCFSRCVIFDLSKAFSSMYSFDFRFGQFDEHFQYSMIVDATDSVAVLEFSIKESGGSEDPVKFAIVLPHMMMGNFIKELMYHRIGENHQKAMWAAHFVDKIEHVPVEVSAVLGVNKLSVEELMHIKVGDVIMLDSRKDEEIFIYLNGVKTFLGETGCIGKTVAVRLNKVLVE